MTDYFEQIYQAGYYSTANEKNPWCLDDSPLEYEAWDEGCLQKEMGAKMKVDMNKTVGFLKALLLSAVICGVASVLVHYFPQHTFVIAYISGGFFGSLYSSLKG